MRVWSLFLFSRIVCIERKGSDYGTWRAFSPGGWPSDGRFRRGGLQRPVDPKTETAACPAGRLMVWGVSGPDARCGLSAGFRLCRAGSGSGPLGCLYPSGYHRRQHDPGGREGRCGGLRPLSSLRHHAHAGSCYLHRRTGRGHHLCLSERAYPSRRGFHRGGHLRYLCLGRQDW